MLDRYIPVVKPEIGCSLEREVFDKFDVPYIKEQLRRLDKENPTIARFIRKFSKTTEDRVGAAFCGIIVYRLLESQAEANRMTYEDMLADSQVFAAGENKKGGSEGVDNGM